MALENYQYNKILRQYDMQQLEINREINNRKKEIYEKITDFQKIDDEIIKCAAQNTKLSILGDNIALEQLKIKIKNLKKSKENLLIKFGYPIDYLEPHYKCSLCKDTGYVDGKKCKCFYQAIINLLYEQSNIKEIIKKNNFDNFNFDYYNKNMHYSELKGRTPYENIVSIVNKSKLFIKNFNSKYENIFIFGEIGVGKTYLTNCIAKELLDLGYSVIYFTAIKFFEILTEIRLSNNKQEFNYINTCDLIIIDDLGTEYNNSLVNSEFYSFINTRILNQKSVIISSNLDLNFIQTRYSGRVYSRIIDSYMLFRIICDDIRIKNAKKILDL